MSENLNNHFLYASTIHVAARESLIQTVLGSCVAICLWDQEKGIGGMNHYMLPYWEGQGLSSPKYGNVAIPKLIEKMIRMGSTRESLVAKVFGGAEVLNFEQHSFHIGDRNINVAWEFLEKERIKVSGYHVGGNQGRKINFNTASGKVLLKMLEINKSHAA